MPGGKGGRIAGLAKKAAKRVRAVSSIISKDDHQRASGSTSRRGVDVHLVLHPLRGHPLRRGRVDGHLVLLLLPHSLTRRRRRTRRTRRRRTRRGTRRRRRTRRTQRRRTRRGSTTRRRTRSLFSSSRRRRGTRGSGTHRTSTLSPSTRVCLGSLGPGSRTSGDRRCYLLWNGG